MSISSRTSRRWNVHGDVPGHSADAHPVSGGFGFSIGEAGVAPMKSIAELAGGVGVGRASTTAFGVVRAIQYGAIALAIGGFAFLLLPWLGGCAPPQGRDASGERLVAASSRGEGRAWGCGRRGRDCGAVGIVLQCQTASVSALLAGWARPSCVRPWRRTRLSVRHGCWWDPPRRRVLLLRRTGGVREKPSDASRPVSRCRGLGSTRHPVPIPILLALLARSRPCSRAMRTHRIRRRSYSQHDLGARPRDQHLDGVP